MNPSELLPSPAVTKPRDADLAFRLAWSSTGLGHFYAGAIVRGLAFQAGALVPLALAVFLMSAACGSIPLVLSLGAASVLIGVWSCFDAVAVARRTRPDYRLKDYNRLSAYLALSVTPTVVIVAAIVVTFRAQVGEPLRAAHDFPALGIHGGDDFVESKLAYRSGTPQRGDLIAYRAAPSGKPMRFGRIAALPGEMADTPKGQIVVPEDSLWVEGHGGELISSYAVAGKLVFRYWPLNRFGPVRPVGAEAAREAEEREKASLNISHL